MTAPLALALALLAAPPPDGPAPVRDPYWVGRPGGTALAISDPTPAGRDEGTLRLYAGYAAARDRAGTGPIEAGGGVVLLAPGTSLKVVARRAPAAEGPGHAGRAGLSGAEMGRAIQSAVLARGAATTATTAPVLEVRVLDGPHGGEARVVAESDVGELMPRPLPPGYLVPAGGGTWIMRSFPPAREPARRPGEKPVEAAVRAENLYSAARRHEAKGRRDEAARDLLRAIWAAPESATAGRARKRLAALGVVLGPDGQYRLTP